MTLLEPIAGGILAAARSSRLGTPASARIVAHATADHGRIEGLLAEGLAAVAQWLGDPAARITARGDPSSGQMTALVECQGGQTGLVSVGVQGLGPPLVEAYLAGTRGVVSLEGWPPPVGANESTAESLPDGARRLLAAAKDSAGRRTPVELAGTSPSRAASLRFAGGWVERLPHNVTPTKPPYGLLLVSGNRTHQENYGRALAADPRCKLIAVADEPDVHPLRAQLNAQLARELGVPYSADLKRALARDDVHVVSICAEPERRGRIAVQAAQAGKHLYLDKPHAASLDEAAHIAAAVRKAGVVCQMFSLVRSAPSLRVREALSASPKPHAGAAAGALGDLAAIHFDLFFAKGHTGSVEKLVPRRETAQPNNFEHPDAKRELFCIGVYPLVQLRWLLGRPAQRVYCVSANYFFAEHQALDMEDHALLLLELEGGLVVSLACGRTGWRSHPSSGLNRTYLVGSKGVACVDAARPRLEVWADEVPWAAPPRNPDDPMGFWTSTTQASGAKPKQSWLPLPGGDVSDFRYFLDCIEQGRQSDVSADVCSDVLRVLLAAYQSAAERRWVEL